MKKVYVAILICAVVVAVLASFIFTWSTPKAQVGIFYYVWYDNSSE